MIVNLTFELYSPLTGKSALLFAVNGIKWQQVIDNLLKGIQRIYVLVKFFFHVELLLLL